MTNPIVVKYERSIKSPEEQEKLEIIMKELKKLKSQ